MKMRSARFLPLEIPFVEQFAHATKTRRASDAVLLKLTMQDGTSGWGETLVRPYLTGETVELLLAAAEKLGPDLAAAEWRLALDAPDPQGKLAPITAALDAILARIPPPHPASVRAWNGLRCALELAVIDALLRHHNMGLADLLPPSRKEVVYSGVISAEDPEKVLKIARQLRQLGLQHYKLKVTPTTAVELLHDVRSIIGVASLRLDANASFPPIDAAAFCRAVEPIDIAAIEEPLVQATPETLAALQRETKIPLMCDEGLVTTADAAELIRCKAVRMFNVRLAKCGGLAPCLALAKTAQEAGIALQLGALVGETAILSAVGRALAAANESFQFVEGSFGTLLLKQDVAHPSIRFGHGGRAPLLRGAGLNVVVDEAVVLKYALPDRMLDLDLAP